VAFLPGWLQSTDAAPNDGFAAAIVPVNSAEHFTAFAANDNLCKAVVAAVEALFTIGACIDHSPAYQLFLYPQEDVLWNDCFVVAFHIVLRNDALQREIIETESELKKLETQANQSATAVQKIASAGEKMKTAGDNISSAGQKMLSVTAAVTGLGTAAVTTAANFESSMSQVQATMGITKDAMSTVDGQTVNTMDTLNELAKKMGSETAFSASEYAQALNYLALAGYDTQQMCDTLPTVLNLAAASGNRKAYLFRASCRQRNGCHC
jgi:hypothetical protein